MVAIEHPAKQPVVRDLALNVGVLVLCLVLQLIILLTQGPSHTAWGVYTGAMAGLLGVACISLALARDGYIPQAMNLYAWSGMAALLAMMAASMELGENLPAMMVVIISAGVMWLYEILNWPSALAYACAALLGFTILGIIHDQLDNVIPAVVWLGICVRFGTRLWHSFRLRIGVMVRANGGRTPGTGQA